MKNATLLFLLFMGHLACMGQSASDLKVNQRIRFKSTFVGADNTADASDSKWIKARIMSIDPGGMYLDMESDRDSAFFLYQDLNDIQIYVGGRRLRKSIGYGVLIGSVIGTGIISQADFCILSCSKIGVGAGVALGATGGLIAGTLVGVLSLVHPWKKVKPTRARLSIQSNKPSQIGLTYTF